MAGFLALILQLLAWMIIARVLLSWFPDARRHPMVQILYQITDPIMLPLQRLNLRAGMFDFSPIIAILVLQFLAAALSGRGLF